MYIYMYEYKVQSLHLATGLLLEFQLSHSDFRSWQGNWQCWGFTAQAQWHKRRAIQQTKRLGCSRSFKSIFFHEPWSESETPESMSRIFAIHILHIYIISVQFSLYFKYLSMN